MPKPPVTPAVMYIHWCMTILVPFMLLMSGLQLAGCFGLHPGRSAVMHHLMVGLPLLAVFLVRRQVRRNHHRPPLPSGHMPGDRSPQDEHGQRGRRIKQPLAWLTWAALLSGITLFVVHKFPGTIPASASHLLLVTHVLCAALVAILTLVHIMDALFHQFVLKDGAINRMFFRLPASAKVSQAPGQPVHLS